MTAEELARIEGLLEQATALQGSTKVFELAEAQTVAAQALWDNRAALIALARRALELESAMQVVYRHGCNIPPKPTNLFALASELGWSPTAKGEHD